MPANYGHVLFSQNAIAINVVLPFMNYYSTSFPGHGALLKYVIKTFPMF
ncbi:hypothetical protein ACFSPU_08925 [Haoranjiania flava]|uniref:Uncharacterized protein n=1 Tax=Haoranjiania flava TaxID=1856322 RepID=A0AAE3IJH3_9BACT|nr:hypothetical protein [Haoranjiania flava]MCU7693217.1 hypothetical protein [Haoranjiania flava]